MDKKVLYRNIALSVVVFWLAFMVVIPNFLVLMASFMSMDTKDFVVLPFNVDNYLGLFDPILFKLIMNSMKVAMGATICCLLIGYPFSYCIATVDKKYRSLLMMLIIVPFWTNSLIRNYSLITILSTGGLFNEFLIWAKIIKEPIQILYTNWAVFIGMTYTLLPFAILPLYSSLEKMDHKLIEAGRDLGANFWQILFRIMIPQTLPGIIASVILVFLPALSMFYISDLLGGADTMVVGNIIRNKFLIARDWPMGSAVSIFLTIIMLILYVFYNKSVKAISAGSKSKQGGLF